MYPSLISLPGQGSSHSLTQPATGRSPSTLVGQSTVSPLRIVALGDSVIYGYGDPDGGGWVERLRRRWMQPNSAGHVLYNLGIRGDGVRQVAQRLEDEFRHRGELRHRVPDVIILSVGTNDYRARVGRRHGRNLTEFDDFEHDLDDLLDRASQLCPVLFVGMTPVDEAQMPFAEMLHYNHDDQYRYKEATRLACEQRTIPYLDIFDRWMQRSDAWWRSHLCPDGLHPNTAGYQAILDDVLTWDCGYNWAA